MSTQQLGLPALPAFTEIDQNPGPQWSKWLARFERLMIAMDVDSAKRKRALLLHYAGPKVDEIFDTLTDTGTDDEYDKAVDALNKYFQPKANSLYEVYVFRQAKQEANETLDHYVTRLRQLAQNCKFSNVDREITAQVIMHCQSSRLRRQALFKGDDLTLQQLLEMGRSFESSEQQAGVLEGGTVNSLQPDKQELTSDVNAMRGRSPKRSPHTFKGRKGNRSQSRRGRGRGRGQSQGQSRGRSKNQSSECYFCGGQYPHKGQCPAKDKECRSCHKMGHFERVCRSTKSTKRINQVEQCDEEYAFTIHDTHHVAYNTSQLPMTEVFAGKSKIHAVIDSGATVNILDEQTYKQLTNTQHLPMSRPKSQIYPYGSNTPLPVKGVVQVKLHSSNNVSCHAEFHVVQAKGNLLSYATASKLKLITINHVSNPQLKTEEIHSQYAPMFEGIGKVKDKQIKLHIDESV